MFRLIYVVVTRNEGHDMTGYFLSGGGRHTDVAGVMLSWAKLPSSFITTIRASVAFIGPKFVLEEIRRWRWRDNNLSPQTSPSSV